MIGAGNFSGYGIGLIGLAVAAIAEEERRIAEGELWIRNIAGDVMGQRAIDWARKYHTETAPTVPYRYTLSQALSAAYHRLCRGDTITEDLQWRTR